MPISSVGTKVTARASRKWVAMSAEKGDPRADPMLDHEQIDMPQQTQQGDRAGDRQRQQELDHPQAEDRILQSRHQEPAGNQAAHGQAEDEAREHAGKGIRGGLQNKDQQVVSTAPPAPTRRIPRRRCSPERPSACRGPLMNPRGWVASPRPSALTMVAYRPMPPGAPRGLTPSDSSSARVPISTLAAAVR